jgi:8-oxo-dGTP pyrophosphatase MutT (NUDIX family)
VLATETLLEVLDAFQPLSDDERQDVARIRELARSGDAWSRSLPLHVTGSAVVVHPPTRRVLLRWHERQQAWLQVGGHADPGENDPYRIALREAREETGLTDLVAWPAARTSAAVHVAIVPVPAGKGEPAHQHADVRYVLATTSPEAVRPETKNARLEWLSFEDAMARVGEDNLKICLQRVAKLLPEVV